MSTMKGPLLLIHLTNGKQLQFEPDHSIEETGFALMAGGSIPGWTIVDGEGDRVAFIPRDQLAAIAWDAYAYPLKYNLRHLPNVMDRE